MRLLKTNPATKKNQTLPRIKKKKFFKRFMKLFMQGAEDPAGFAPSFIEKPRIIPNESGTLITMKCKCRAKPKPEITWFRGNNAIGESAKISLKCVDVQEDIYELSLELKVYIYLHISLNEYFENNDNKLFVGSIRTRWWCIPLPRKK